MRLPVVQHPGRTCDVEDDVGAKGGPAREGPGGGGWFMGWKAECSSTDRVLCGFGKEGGIPTCKALETSEQLVKWTRYKNLREAREEATSKPTSGEGGQALRPVGGLQEAQQAVHGSSCEGQVADKLPRALLDHVSGR